jgi:hypothetical protein
LKNVDPEAVGKRYALAKVAGCGSVNIHGVDHCLEIHAKNAMALRSQLLLELDVSSETGGLEL